MLVVLAVNLGPTWLLSAVQTALLLALVLTNPAHLRFDRSALRVLGLVSAVGAIDLATLVHLVVRLLGGSNVSAPNFVVAALVILMTNVVASAVLLWDLDVGGPSARSSSHARPSEPPGPRFPQRATDPD